MSLDALTSDRSRGNSTTYSPPRSRSYAWLLPVCLLIGFLAILGLLFGKRLIPAVEVKTAPVITIRAGEALQQAHSTDSSSTLDTNKATVQSSPTSATPTKGNLIFQASGWVEPAPYTTFAPSLINGIVNEVLVLEGDTVKKGQTLATLVDIDAELDLQTAQKNYSAFEKQIIAHCTEHEVIDSEIIAAKSNVASMQAQLARAQDVSDRLAKLRKGSVAEQVVSQAKLDTEAQTALLEEAKTKTLSLDARKAQIESQKETMEANLEGLAIARERAQVRFDRTKIKAPMDGIILKLHAAPGMKRMLEMDSITSSVIAEMYDPNKLQARIDVPLNEAAALTVNQQVELISDLLPNQTFTGIVTSISGQADLQRNTLQAKIKINNPDVRLRPDMLMRAKFFSTNNDSNKQLSSSAKNSSSQQSNISKNTGNLRLAIYVPEAALINDSSVWVVSSDNTAEQRNITLAHPSQNKEEHRLVSHGLNSGEHVILPPHNDLKDGVRVTTIK